MGSRPDDPIAALSASSLEVVLCYLPVFEDPGFTPGVERGGIDNGSGVIDWPWFEYAPAVSEFHQRLYDAEWIVRFNWTEWQDDARALLEGDGIESADIETLQRLLTVIVRKERFAEGTLAYAFDRGWIVRILRRATAIRDLSY